MLRIGSILALLSLAGCAATAQPNAINGRYYWAGDTSCSRYQQIGPSRIMCLDPKGQQTGYRDAMSQDELYMYQMNMARQQAESNATMAQINANNQAMAAQNAAQTQQNSMWRPPAVQPIYSPNSNQVRCIGVGIYASCRY